MKKQLSQLLVRSIMWALLYSASFSVSRMTFAFYSDTAHSSQNIFTVRIPDATPTPESGTVVLNEISVQGDETHEWIELYNSGDSPVDLANWSIRDNTSSDTVSTRSALLQPHNYAVIVSTNFSLPDSSDDFLILQIPGTLGNGLAINDQIQLIDDTSVVQDQFSYGTSLTSPSGAILPYFPHSPGSGQSIMRIPDGQDTDNASDFQLSTSPTFGIANHL